MCNGIHSQILLQIALDEGVELVNRLIELIIEHIGFSEIKMDILVGFWFFKGAREVHNRLTFAQIRIEKSEACIYVKIIVHGIDTEQFRVMFGCFVHIAGEKQLRSGRLIRGHRAAGLRARGLQTIE